MNNSKGQSAEDSTKQVAFQPELFYQSFIDSARLLISQETLYLQHVSESTFVIGLLIFLAKGRLL